MQKYLLIILMLWISIRKVDAQQTAFYHDPDKKFKDGYELFVKEKYSAAADVLEDYLNQPHITPLNVINAEFYIAVSAFELFHPDAETKLLSFIGNYPENTKVSLANFYLAKFYYRQKRYRNALPYFEKTDVYYLSNTDIPEYYFKSGYCFYMKGDLEKASKNFKEIINVDSRYQTAAQYYYAHIAYANNNYNTALEIFQKLNSSETFGPIVPYYITQIYFEQAKYDSLLAYTNPILEKGGVQNENDMRRLVAESYYRKADYKSALKEFHTYSKNVPVMSRNDFYSLGYSEYRNEDYKNAVEHLQKVVDVNDSLSQNAYYHLADCFLNTGNKQSARNAFQSAAKMDFNNSIKETSLFNYAKLSAELNFQPVAINAFRDFLKDYPQSKNADEANELVAQLYLTTHNYKDALASLENIKVRVGRAKEAYQKVAYYRGVEFFNDGDLDKAINMFEKAIVNDVDQTLRAQAIYWKAEALYNQEKFDAAVKQYRIYIFNPPSVNTTMYNLANYNMGYCYFKKSEYDSSQTWFRKYIKNKAEADKAHLDDANIRVGDCFYAMRQTANALDFYNAAIENNASSSDYALYQKGIIQGLQGDLNAKSGTMQALMTRYPKSQYQVDALFEKGRAQLAQGNDEEAKKSFNDIIKNYPSSAYSKRALVNVGLIYYNDKQDEQALATYKQVITQYPGSNEASEALTGVKNIYVNSGRPNEYFDYVKTVPNASVSTGAQDSITYEAAEQRYLKGNFDDAAKDFESYLTNFPNGAFRLNATFYKAESDYRNKNNEAALTGYEYIVTQPRNVYTEKSLSKAAYIQFKSQQYDKAITNYQKLEQIADLRDNIIAAQAGLMRSYYLTDKFNESITYAQKLIAGNKVPNEIISEAHLTYARSAMNAKDYTNAQKEFSTIAKQSGETGAEAKYNLASIQYNLANYKQSKEECFDVINQVPSYDYWIAKSFILLADNYVALKDTFQAKETLKSVLNNYEKNPADKEDIREIAKQKYDALINTSNQDVLNNNDENKNVKPEEDLSKDEQQ